LKCHRADRQFKTEAGLIKDGADCNKDFSKMIRQPRQWVCFLHNGIQHLGGWRG
jgi:hypothetical protein